MIDVTEFIKHSREERRKHLKLDEPCCERGGNSTNHKGVLAQYLGTTIPSGRILLCHACNNGKCSNPRHLYWGTDKENITIDNPDFKSAWHRTVEKYGIEEAIRRNSTGDKSAGGKANKGKQKSEEHKRKISESVKKNVSKKGGRKPAVPYAETYRVWQELGIAGGAEKFNISKEAFKHRVYQAKKMLTKTDL